MKILINQGSRTYHLIADLIHTDYLCERYKVYPPKDPDKFIILENNKPLIRGKYKLKKRRIDWKQIEGKRMSDKTLQEIIKYIESPPIPEKELPKAKSTAKARKDYYTPGPTLGEIMKNKDGNKEE